MVEATLAHYRVGPQLGAGGMGVVYQATDTHLGRQVALKLLHDSSVDDPARVARFEREARLLASLNHPNIGSIYGFEKSETCTFLVLELIPGETLAERIGRGPLPFRETLEVARQIAQALEAAHEVGVVHRDLKPANVKITPDGTAKVLDFGLAKGVLAADQNAHTVVRGDGSLETTPGTLVGTVSYMSPEQASGREIDQRTDIWAFGCVLFEMLTGVRPFAGTSNTEVLVAILDREPDWSLLPAGTPDNVRALLRRCLAKDLRARLRHAGDARLELEETLSGIIPAVRATKPRRETRLVAALAIAALVVAASAGALWWALHRGDSKTPPRLVRFAIDLPAGKQIRPSWDIHMTFSRDSGRLLYLVNYPPPSTLYSRRLDNAESETLTDFAGFINPLYSPDGKWLLFADTTKRELVKFPLSGGAPVPLAPFDMFFRGDWSSDGYVYWNDHLMGSIIRTPEDGGPPERITKLDEKRLERSHRFARLIPGRNAVLFTVASGDIDSFDDARIDVFDLETKKQKTIVRGGTSARYSPSGHIVYARGGSLFAVPFDVDRLEVTGMPVKVLQGVLMSTSIGTAYFEISPNGDLAYAAGPPENGERTMYWVDRKGNAQALPLPPRPYLNPRISPDGEQVAYEVEGANHDFYVYDFDRGVASRMTNDGISHAPVWSPDGTRIAYRTSSAGKMTLAWMPADRSAPAERLVDVVEWQNAASFSPDGKYIVFDQINPGTRTDVWVLPLDGKRKPRPFSSTPSAEGAGKFSPDGRWIVYCSQESGQAEIYAQSWPGPGQKIQLSSEGGTDPVWRRDGREIFYRNAEKMMVVPVELSAGFRPGKPQLLWTADYMHGLSSSCGFKGATTTSYDVSPDGQRLLMIRDNDSKMFATKIVVVLNWAEELKRVVAAANRKSTTR